MIKKSYYGFNVGDIVELQYQQEEFPKGFQFEIILFPEKVTMPIPEKNVSKENKRELYVMGKDKEGRYIRTYTTYIKKV